MNILMFVPGGVDTGGGHRVIPVLSALIKRLSARHRVTIAAFNQPGAPDLYPHFGAEVFNLSRRFPPLKRKDIMGILLKTVRLIATRRRRFDIIHSFWIGWTSSLAVLSKSVFHCPLVVSLGGGELIRLPLIRYGGALRWTGRFHAFLAMRSASRMTAGSQSALNQIIPFRSDALCIPLFPDLRLDGEDTRVPPGPPWRLLTVSSINPVKDPYTLLKAVRLIADSVPDVILDWIGEDILNGSAQRFARLLKIDRQVRFHGFRPHECLRNYFRNAHLYVQSSYYESQGVAVCEAVMAGLPLVGTDVGILAELAPDAALVSKPGDHRGLAANILKVIKDHELRQSLSENSRSRARFFSADRTAGEFEKLYSDIARVR